MKDRLTDIPCRFAPDLFFSRHSRRFDLYVSRSLPANLAAVSSQLSLLVPDTAIRIDRETFFFSPFLSADRKVAVR